MTKTENNRVWRLYAMDNLPVLRSIDSETADLVYLAPPFNSGKQWRIPFGEGTRAAPLQDTWELPDTPAHKEALPMANDTKFSLATGVFTRDMSRALKMAKHLDAGVVYTNNYFADEVAFPFFGERVKKTELAGKEVGTLVNYIRVKNVVTNIGRAG